MAGAQEQLQRLEQENQDFSQEIGQLKKEVITLKQQDQDKEQILAQLQQSHIAEVKQLQAQQEQEM